MCNVLGERIKELRKERGMTLEELGNVVGLSKGNLSMVESGKQGLNAKNIKHIA